jgi:hypothetical protein
MQRKFKNKEKKYLQKAKEAGKIFKCRQARDEELKQMTKNSKKFLTRA